jgi:hypothetical protein
VIPTKQGGHFTTGIVLDELVVLDELDEDDVEEALDDDVV